MVQTNLRNADLSDLANLLQDQQTRKLDVVTPATSIRSVNGQIVLQGTDAELTEEGVTPTEGEFRPTDMFDEGVASKLNIPLSYMRRIRAERPDLVDANVNGWLHGFADPVREDHDSGHHLVHGDKFIEPDSRSFLVRTFRGDDGPGIARALLSDRYGIVDNLDVLMSALDGVRAAGVDVNIDGCDLTEKRMRVRVVAPEVQALAPELLKGYRSPFTGESGADNPIVFAGFEISNSETGGGAFTLTPRIVVKVCSNGMTITKDAIRGVHLGSKMDAGVISWSQDTQQRALDLVKAKTRDAVASFMDVEYVRSKVAEISEAADRPVEDAAKTIEIVGQRLQYSQEQQSSILDHFIRGGQLTAGGVMNAVTSVAQTLSNGDEAAELEASALRVLEAVPA